MESRFHLKVNFQIYEKKFKWDCSLDWFSEDETEIDQRITDWFLACYNEAYSDWLAKITKEEAGLTREGVESE